MLTLTEIDQRKLDALKAGLKDVTPGPWREGLFCVGAINSTRGHEPVAVATIFALKDVAHIARCDPDTIGALIDRIEKAERERDVWMRRATEEREFSAKETERADNAERKLTDLFTDRLMATGALKAASSQATGSQARIQSWDKAQSTLLQSAGQTSRGPRI